MSIGMARCGRISYTNDLPVYAGIDDDVVQFPGTMVAGVPSYLNQALLAGQLDISPISSAFYAAHPDELTLLPDFCIGAFGRVFSICCIANVDIKELGTRTVAITRESVSGRTLFQLICRRHFGFDPIMVESDDPFAQYLADGTPCLLIGDKAIDAAEQAPSGSVHDLGQLWFDLTGQGMVYAVWAARSDYVASAPVQVTGVAAALRGSLQWGLDNKGLVIERAQRIKPRAVGFYEQYYRALRFQFDGQARAALEAFIGAAHEAGLIAALPALRFVEELARHG